jgi:hypothetical protein
VVSGGSVWQGEASLGAGQRIELRPSPLSVGGSCPLIAVGYGLEGAAASPA